MERSDEGRRQLGRGWDGEGCSAEGSPGVSQAVKGRRADRAAARKQRNMGKTVLIVLTLGEAVTFREGEPVERESE